MSETQSAILWWVGIAIVFLSAGCEITLFLRTRSEMKKSHMKLFALFLIGMIGVGVLLMMWADPLMFVEIKF